MGLSNWLTPLWAELNVTEVKSVTPCRCRRTGEGNRSAAIEPLCAMHPDGAKHAKIVEDARQLGRLNFCFNKNRGQ